MSSNTLYIIDPTKEFKGHVENTMNKDTGLVHYRENTSFEDYKKEKGNENLVTMTWEELEEKYIIPYKNNLQKPFKEITEEDFNEMLNVLPPMRWTRFENGRFFFISEAYTADLHSLYVKYKGKYYTGLRSRFMKDEDIKNQIEDQCQ